MIDCKGLGGAQVPSDDGIAASPEQPGLDRTTQGRIGSHLRAMYDELMQQPIPDRFIDLLAELDGSRKKAERDT
ncbi:NepR family anti-sigma factor [Methylobacterium sp. ID0610]|uniref:NepR family anti-sigma factor n=1 Tax=Methylobacterium carpenticola TaxID=3344827 RepID=UPI00368D6890